MDRYIPCMTRMLIHSHNVAMTHCSGSDDIRVQMRCCSGCEFWDETLETTEGAEFGECSLRFGFETEEAPYGICPGDNDILEVCSDCPYFNPGGDNPEEKECK